MWLLYQFDALNNSGAIKVKMVFNIGFQWKHCIVMSKQLNKMNMIGKHNHQTQ